MLVLALAGLQWLRSREGMNVFFLLDRSDSIPSRQQEAAQDLCEPDRQEQKAVGQGGVDRVRQRGEH